MRLKLRFKTPKSVNFQFGAVSVVIGTDPTDVDDKYGQALLQQYPKWVQKVKPVANK
jgi:hypothetical protein